MSCAHPILALDNGFKINDEGKKVRDIKLLDMKHKYFGYGIEELKEKYGDSLLLLPCGHCYSCGIDYARMWASRIMLEAEDHSHNCFITLTYDEFHCPERLSKRDLQLFIKRLRKAVQCPIRFFACGERGEKSNRPHYHAIIFGYDFPDKVELKRSGSGLIIYRSPLLEKLWSIKDKNGRLVSLGISSIGSVTPESAQYVAKYSLKRKLTGVDSDEFVLMSRRPGIGLNGYKSEQWSTDKLYLFGQHYKIPRYFDKVAEQKNDFLGYIAKEERKERAKMRSSKKFMYHLDREEYALEKENDDRVVKDAMKVRLSI